MSAIYKKVTTQSDFDIFYETLTPSWLEMHYTMECMLGDITRYIVFSENDLPVGTLEMIPYKPYISSDLDDKYYPFKKEKVVAENIGRVVEIDSVSILPEHRKEGNIERIAYTVSEHCRKNNINYVIGLMNPLLYLALRGTYRVPVKNMGKANRKAKYYPIIMDIKQVYTNLDKFPWLSEMYKKDKNPFVKERRSLHVVSTV